MAILEAIDRDLEERGLVDKAGKPRYLLNGHDRTAGARDRLAGADAVRRLQSVESLLTDDDEQSLEADIAAE
jgi:hypothetical protein